MLKDIDSTFITLAQLSKELNISKSTAYALTKRPDFPTLDISPKRILIPREELEKWLTAHMKGGVNADNDI